MGLRVGPIPRDRTLLHKEIAIRFSQMLAAGFVEEVRMLRAQPGVHSLLPSMKAVGYRQVLSFLEGKINEKLMIESSLAATRQLAKRQYTWLRGWKNLNVLRTPDISRALKIVTESTILE